MATSDQARPETYRDYNNTTRANTEEPTPPSCFSQIFRDKGNPDRVCVVIVDNGTRRIYDYTRPGGMTDEAALGRALHDMALSESERQQAEGIGEQRPVKWLGWPVLQTAQQENGVVGTFGLASRIFALPLQHPDSEAGQNGNHAVAAQPLAATSTPIAPQMPDSRSRQRHVPSMDNLIVVGSQEDADRRSAQQRLLQDVLAGGHNNEIEAQGDDGVTYNDQTAATYNADPRAVLDAERWAHERAGDSLGIDYDLSEVRRQIKQQEDATRARRRAAWFGIRFGS